MRPRRQLLSFQCSAHSRIMGHRSMVLYHTLEGGGHAHQHHRGSGAEDDVFAAAPAPPIASHVPLSAPAAPARPFEMDSVNDDSLRSGLCGIRRTTVIRMWTQRWGEAQDDENGGAADGAWVDTDTKPDGAMMVAGSHSHRHEVCKRLSAERCASSLRASEDLLPRRLDRFLVALHDSLVISCWQQKLAMLQWRPVIAHKILFPVDSSNILLAAKVVEVGHPCGKILSRWALQPTLQPT
ncbi:hypothetical protein BGW80DRAFT_1445368 [Lactifluus volemus]|nr:hypothetical protein BGW80DRAFT_1445368 [Lactifluus volemus]